MSKLSFEEFRKANLERKKQFFKGAQTDNWSVSDCFMAAIGELGETANALKKVRRAELGIHNKNAEGRQINSLDEARAQVAGEIGGFMCYLDQLCDIIGLRLEDCIVDEFNKKSEELGFPERLIAGAFMLQTSDGTIFHPGIQPEVFAAEVMRSKYRETWPDTLARFASGAPYSEQPFNERRILFPGTEGVIVPKETVCSIVAEPGAELVSETLQEDITFGRVDWITADRQVSAEVITLQLPEPIECKVGDVIKFGISEDNKPIIFKVPDIPTVWHDGCGKCEHACMDMDMDPFCVHPDIKAQGWPSGLDIRPAVNTYCGKEGKLSLFFPRQPR